MRVSVIFRRKGVYMLAWRTPDAAEPHHLTVWTVGDYWSWADATATLDDLERFHAIDRRAVKFDVAN